MVGGGRRDQGSLVINNTNVFAALDTLKKKKKSDKDRKSKGSTNSKSSSSTSAKSESQVFWAPAPLNATSWADVDDDDDYYATTAPPQSVWSIPESQHSKDKPENFEDTESDEDILDEGDDEVEEEHDHEPEPEPTVKPESEVKKHTEVPAAPKEAERQLSKKERKKKELEELEALLADFGVTQKESNDGQGRDDSQGAPQDNKGVEADGDGEKKESAESKNAKKKKKKDKTSKEVKETNDQPNSSEVSNGPDLASGTANVEEDTLVVDVKERLKRVASTKKKSSKEMDTAARAAAQEAAARNARLAAAKKKEKKHYNQQPVR